MTRCSGRTWLAASAALMLLAVTDHAAWAGDDWPAVETGYSGKAVTVTNGRRSEMRLWYQDGRQRQEIRTGDREQIVIVRPDRGEMYSLDPRQGVAMVMPFDMESMGMTLPEAMKKLSPEAVGRARVGGEPTTRYRLDGTGPLGTPQTGTAWVTDDGILVKLDSRTELGGEPVASSFELTDIERGRQPATLFEIPDGFEVQRMGR